MNPAAILEIPTPWLSLYAASAGVLSHLGYFIKGEHHMEAPLLLTLMLLLPVLLFMVQLKLTTFTPLFVAIRSATVMSSYLVSLWASMAIYRIFFHPLRNFPGPFAAKVSKLWHVSRLVARIDNYRQLDQIHKRYGDFVRTGPSEISVFVPEAVPIILGARSRCIKAPWYDVSLPLISMHTARDRATHDKRRRIWEHGFGANALRAYDDRILSHTKTLVSKIGASAGNKVNAMHLFHYYAFDVMADIAFGKSFEMLNSDKSRFVLDLLKDGLYLSGVLTPVPWAYVIFASIPGMGSSYKRFVSWCAEQAEQRRKVGKQMEVQDVMSWLVDSYEKSSTKDQEMHWLNGDSRLVILAGSDTISAALTYMLYRLAQNPHVAQKLREEINSALPSVSELRSKNLQRLEYLNSVIDETLRLHPPIPAGMLRVTPPEGITVGDTFIPGGTTVVTPTYTQGRLESCYVHANEFIPERWTSRPELIKNKIGFAPFSSGPYACIGKQLALMELRAVACLLLQKFEISFASGEDGHDLVENSEDVFTLSAKDLNLIFTPRIV